MDDQVTCGKGLAANAKLPATMGELIAAMVDVLHVHQQALDLTDENAKPEHVAYVTLERELRSISSQLDASARHMTGYRDLPMGRHDEEKMSAREAIVAFERFLAAERALLSLLTASVAEHQTLIEQMR